MTAEVTLFEDVEFLLGEATLRDAVRAGMVGLAEKGLAELEALAADLRKQIALDPQHSRAALGDIEWEIEKRRWRKEPPPSATVEP